MPGRDHVGSDLTAAPQPEGFRAVKAEILRRVRTRLWPPGHLLPPETALAEGFGCARATVNRALRELAEDGVVERRRRAGTRVSAAPVRRARFDVPQIRAEIEAAGAICRYALVSRSELAAPAWLSAALALPQGARVLHVVSVHFADDRPWVHEDRWINLAAVPEAAGESFETVSANEWLVRSVPFSDAEMAVSAARCDEATGRFLGLAAGDALLRIERTTWLGEVPVTRATLSHPPGYRLVTRL
jgi:GntR family transcriptional regulator, histidine utilization repressor